MVGTPTILLRARDSVTRANGGTWREAGKTGFQSRLRMNAVSGAFGQKTGDRCYTELLKKKKVWDTVGPTRKGDYAILRKLQSCGGTRNNQQDRKVKTKNVMKSQEGQIRATGAKCIVLVMGL